MLQHLEKRQKIIIMIAILSGLFLAALDQTIVGTALPTILTEFNALKELSWVITAYLLTSTIAVPISGKLSDLYGRRKLLLVGIIIFVIASMLCGVAQGIWQLIGFRALQGIGGGILMSNAFTAIGDLFDARERGKWQGIFGAIFGLASLFGPLLGGYLTDGASILSLTTDWRWTFFINVPVGVIAFSLIAKFMPTVVTSKDKGIDYLGASLLTATLSCFVLAASFGGSSLALPWSNTMLDLAWTSPTIVGLFIACAVSLAAFIFAEKKAQDPILPLDIFKNSTLTTVSILFALFGFAFFGALIYLPTFAQQVLGFSATNSGIIMLPMVVGMTVSSMSAGQIVEKTGKYKIIAASGLAIAALGIFALSGLNALSDYWDLAWRMAVAGFGLGMTMPIFTLAVQNALPQEKLGIATSTTQLSRSIGGTLGLAIMGGVLNSQLTNKLANISEDNFVKITQSSGQVASFEDLDANTIQSVLSEQGQASILAQLQSLPEQLRELATNAFIAFTSTLQSALASSITSVFFISGCAIVLALIICILTLKDIPLKHHKGVIPTEG